MRLDYVELILAIEEAFQIRLSDEEASAIQTAGDLHYLISRKYPGNPEDVWEGLCAAISSAGVPREDIKPETRLDDLGIV